VVNSRDQNRRNFLKSSAQSALGLIITPDLVTLFQSWQKDAKPTADYGIQLYMVKEDMLAGPKATLSKLSKLGYTSYAISEIGFEFPCPPRAKKSPRVSRELE